MKKFTPHPLEGGGVRPQNFSKILLRGKKPLPKNFKAIGTLIQMLLISGTFLAKMFHSALIRKILFLENVFSKIQKIYKNFGTQFFLDPKPSKKYKIDRVI